MSHADHQATIKNMIYLNTFAQAFVLIMNRDLLPPEVIKTLIGEGMRDESTKELARLL